jgi:hypothetical protein
MNLIDEMLKQLNEQVSILSRKNEEFLKINRELQKALENETENNNLLIEAIKKANKK